MALLFTACVGPKLGQKNENKAVPTTFKGAADSTNNSAKVKYKDFFKDPNLVALIDTALNKNQELNILMQEITIAQNEARARKGAYLPMLSVGAGAGVEKTGRYTRNGAVESNLDIKPGQGFPDPLSDLVIGANASWEVDIWKKLRNSRKSAIYRYLSTTEGRNFAITNLVSEIATSYYELTALDNQLDILKKNIAIQQNALEIVKLEKINTRVTELAVKKFEAEVLKNQSHQYYIMQQIVEAENRINFLVGRFPQPVARDSAAFATLVPDTVYTGIPSQLLQNRPDIRRAEQQLAASKLDVKVARAQFYPSLNIMAGVGYNAFNAKYLVTTPQSLMYSLAGELIAPLINRNALKAEYYSANARQIQAVYNYERSILNGYIEVSNQLSNISNLKKSYELKRQQVQALTVSIDISTSLFKSARADYMEVLMTQRDALESKFDLVEIKMQQLNARVNMYRALGGGL
jgi:NodT family efflux transporter outer membrane factor (OMF) lipoprotein